MSSNRSYVPIEVNSFIHISLSTCSFKIQGTIYMYMTFAIVAEFQKYVLPDVIKIRQICFELSPFQNNVLILNSMRFNLEIFS